MERAAAPELKNEVPKKIAVIPKIALEHILRRKGLHKNMQVEFRDTPASARKSRRDFLGRPQRGKFCNKNIAKFGIIGIGNTLRRDDGIGIVILESLLKSNSQKLYGSKANVNLSFRLIEGQKASVNLTLSDPERAERVEGESKGHNKDSIDYFNFGTASFDLIHRMRDYDAVLLIDAIKTSLALGEVRFFELKDVEYNVKESPISTHELNLTGLFELSKKLKLKTKIYVAGIQVEDTSWAEGLSDCLEKRKEDIVKQISAFIDKVF